MGIANTNQTDFLECLEGADGAGMCGDRISGSGFAFRRVTVEVASWTFTGNTF